MSLIGIILGVVNLSTMFSVVEGARVANEAFINSIGEPDVISVSIDWWSISSAVGLQKTMLNWNDVIGVERNVSTVKQVGVEIYLHENMAYGENYLKYTTIGVSPGTFPMRKYNVVEGRPITQIDMDEGNRVCVIGSTVVEQMFDYIDPIGETVKIGDDYFQVIGVLEEYGTYSGYEGSDDNNPMDWKNRRVLIPATTAMQRFIGWGGSGDWFVIYAQSSSAEMIPSTMGEIRNILIKSRNDNDIFSIETMQDWQNSMSDYTKMWQLVLGIVAGISLIVGGIGIMNVMLASFNERVREIGIRKAIGASNVDIFLLFIVETLVICVIGGIIGLGLSYVISMAALRNILQSLMDSQPQFSWDAGFYSIIFSMIVGLLSGIYPAIKAGRLQPVDALRYE